MDDIWVKVLDIIKKELNPVSFSTWFAETKIHDITDNKVTLIVQMPLHKRMFAENYYNLISDAFTTVLGKDIDIESFLEEEITDKTQTTATVNIYDANGEQLTYPLYDQDRVIITKVIGKWKLNSLGTLEDIELYAGDTKISDFGTRTPTKDILIPQEDSNKTKVIIWKSAQTPTEIYDYGKVNEPIEGEWIEWFEWDKPKDWYPTNHVNVAVEIPAGVEYDGFIEEFKKEFGEDIHLKGASYNAKVNKLFMI